MNRPLFDLYVKTQVALTLQPGDVIILLSHRVPRIGCPLPDRAFQAQEGGNGQPVIAQKPWRGSRGEGRRRVVCVFVALQPGSEPCRDGIHQAESPHSKGGSQTLRCAMAAKSVTFSVKRNAVTSSTPQDRRPIDRNTR
jgi:hypothetical protein